jgi:hypothetical protein
MATMVPMSVLLERRYTLFPTEKSFSRLEYDESVRAVVRGDTL